MIRAEKISLCPKPLLSYRTSNIDSITNQTKNVERIFDIFIVNEKEFSLIEKSGFLPLYKKNLLFHALYSFLAGYRKMSDKISKQRFYTKAKSFLEKFHNNSTGIEFLNPQDKDLYRYFTNYCTFTEMEFARENDTMKRDIENYKRSIEDYRKIIDDNNKNIMGYQKSLEISKKNLEEIKNSYSFRIGRAITKIISAPIEFFRKS
jgi:hypothetical protein